MTRVFEDNSYSIGNTPLIRLNRLAPNSPATILAKIEGRNPAYSVKCRIGSSMIWDAEKKGILKPGMEIIEATSGNTGIALAFVAAARGYHLTITMPENQSIERRKVLKALGASFILTEPQQAMQGAIDKANQIIAENPGHYFMPMQFDNPANPAIHQTTTGPEIWRDTDGEIDILVAGIVTGGTITGITRYIKQEKKKPILSVGIEPSCSPVITQTLQKKQLTPQFHVIQGIGAGFIPKNLDLSLVDRIEQVTEKESIDMARLLASQEGILCGISCGAAVVVALRIAAEKEHKGKTIVVVLPDAGERYLSSELFKFPMKDE